MTAELEHPGSQAFHDRIARTVVAQTRRGYSLDLKVKKLIAQSRQRVK